MTTLNHQRAVEFRPQQPAAQSKFRATQPLAGNNGTTRREEPRAETKPNPRLAATLHLVKPAQSQPASSHEHRDLPAPELHLDPHERDVVLNALPELSAREREVLVAICEGGRNTDIAKRLFIAPPTLRTHLTRLNHKLDTTSKADLIRLAAAVLLDHYRTRAPATPIMSQEKGEM